MTQKIDAVNQCLRAIDEAPVNSLSSGVDEAERAATFIDQVTREVLSAGWHNNTDYNITVTPDTAGEIGASADWISIDTVGYSSSIDVTVRVDPNDGLKKLFDLGEQRFTFDAPITVDIVRYYDIDALPFVLSAFIAAHAARRFQEDLIGSATADSRLIRTEAELYARLVDEEAEMEDSNVLTGTLYMQRVTGRNSDSSWR
jgi:hypothetical protein